MEVITLEAGGDANLTYLILPGRTGEAWSVDPASAASSIIHACRDRGLRVTEVFLTHTHFDHLESLEELRSHDSPRIWCHALERSIPGGCVLIESQGPIQPLPEVEVLILQAIRREASCYRIGDNLFTGDTLFVDWIGRADLAGSDPRTLFESLAKIRNLPGDLRIRPGHDYGTVLTRTLSEEAAKNRFFACEDFQRFLELQPELSE